MIIDLKCNSNRWHCNSKSNNNRQHLINPIPGISYTGASLAPQVKIVEVRRFMFSHMKV